MSRPVIAYKTTYGLAGCYLPNSVGSAVEFTTRRELAAFIRAELEAYEMPASLFREVKIRRLWGLLRRRGASCYHFALEHKGWELAFHGLTSEELAQDQGED